jgi:hypothetical protein
MDVKNSANGKVVLHTTHLDTITQRSNLYNTEAQHRYQCQTPTNVVVAEQEFDRKF